MKRLLTLCCCLGFLLPSCLASEAFPAPHTISIPGENLAKAKELLLKDDCPLQPALKRLIADANRALKAKPHSVMDKELAGPSGDKHDYCSRAPYWWPDPDKPKGLPYVRRDGEVNPESAKGTDKEAFTTTCYEVAALGMAYYFTGDHRYAEKAALLTRVWFLDEATRMNPNLNYGQAVMGRSTGRGEGVLEARHITFLLDGIELISHSSAWSADDDAALRKWMGDYYRWVTTSEIGLEERNARNNHGTWYDAQVAHLAIYLGKTEEAKRLLKAGLEKRIASQIKPDGSQPHELARTKSLGYCLFNLEAAFQIAQEASVVGIDWWGFKTEDGRGLRAALDYLAPYADPQKIWPKKDIEEGGRARLIPLFAQALPHYPNSEYARLFERFAKEETKTAHWRLYWL